MVMPRYPIPRGGTVAACPAEPTVFDLRDRLDHQGRPLGRPQSGSPLRARKGRAKMTEDKQKVAAVVGSGVMGERLATRSDLQLREKQIKSQTGYHPDLRAPSRLELEHRCPA